MATSLEDLITKLNQSNQNAYTPLTQEQMQQEAANRYASVYGQKRLTARQQYDQNDQALAQQLAGLQSTYDKQREQSAKKYRETLADADRHMLSRGMQRSSYNNATLANIGLEGDKAQQAINDAQAQQEGNIGEQRKQLSQQLAAQLAQYDEAQQQDILAYVDQLEAREYERAQADRNARNQLAMNIYEYQHQAEREGVQDNQWQAEFNAKYGGGSGGGGGYGGGGSRSSKTSAGGSGGAFDKLKSGLSQIGTRRSRGSNETKLSRMGSSNAYTRQTTKY